MGIDIDDLAGTMEKPRLIVGKPLLACALVWDMACFPRERGGVAAAA